jgi:hypothetical protein
VARFARWPPVLRASAPLEAAAARPATLQRFRLFVAMESSAMNGDKAVAA